MASRFGWNADGQLIDLQTKLPPTAEDHAAGDAANRAMMSAESEFETALRAKYKHRAGDMRYRTNELPPAIKMLALKFRATCAAWRATWAIPE